MTKDSLITKWHLIGRPQATQDILSQKKLTKADRHEMKSKEMVSQRHDATGTRRITGRHRYIRLTIDNLHLPL